MSITPTYRPSDLSEERLAYIRTGDLLPGSLFERALKRLRTQAPVNAMTNTVTVRGSTEYTQRNSQYGKVKKRKLTVYRALAANLCNVYWQFKGLGRPYNFGFFNMSKFWFADTEQYVACPLYMVDLTSTNNIRDPSAGTQNYKSPILRMYKNRSDGTVLWRPVYCQIADGSILPQAALTKASTSTSSTPGVVPSWEAINAETGTATASSILPWARDYISSIDIYLDLFAARNYPTRFKVDVVSLPDWCVPYNANDDGSAEDVTCADKAMHDAYWTNELVTWTVHPLDVQRGTRTGGQPALLYRSGPFGEYRNSPKSHIRGPRFFSFEPKDTSISEPSVNTGARMHREKITLYPNREVDLNYRQKTMYNTTTGDALKPIVDPADGNADSTVRFSTTYTCSPKPEQRMYLIIQSTDFVESTGTGPYTTANCPFGGHLSNSANAWGGRTCTDGAGNPAPVALADFKYAPSFDLNIIKCCRRLN